MDKPNHIIKKNSARSIISAVHNEFTIHTIKGCEEGTFNNKNIKDLGVLALESRQQNVKLHVLSKMCVKESLLDRKLSKLKFDFGYGWLLVLTLYKED